ncbi:SidA/IucD/PvdA family monooxygenase [Streptomyces olivaceiscleroticus]|uniref:L-lysine N6-monooxygenase MbtG n=1 Tax=Streptomyces olivaceiscleroticus TaxID=68245 RepID=A0ABN1BD40_9ACTN
MRNESSPGVRTAEQGSEENPYDLIGVGFGPSNLALAIAAEELDSERTCLFFERSPRLRWHPGMLIEGSRMQISFLKDLVSLRNPASPYTFLQYTKAKNRLERFVNLGEFRPTRLEYQDYLEWVAEFFADRVRYGTEVTKVSPVRRPGEDVHRLFRVTARDVGTGRTTVRYAANVVHAAGGRPRLPLGGVCDSPAVVHSSAFLPRFPDHFADRSRHYEFGVAGDGQSAGEIAAYLMRGYPDSRVHLFLSGQALRGTDNSPFVNEQFFLAHANSFYAKSRPERMALRAELRNTNYGVVEAGFLDDLYRMAYEDEVRGARRLIVHPATKVTAVRDGDGGPRVAITDRLSGEDGEIPCDGVVLATGYSRALDESMLGDLVPFLHTEGEDLVLSPDYRVSTSAELAGGFYVQGYGEQSFGLGDTLLSLLPYRSRQIFTDICKQTPPAVRTRRPVEVSTASAYPPPHYLEADPEHLYAVLERFNFATLISARGVEDPVVTHVPLTLDRSRGEHGVLFGHMDRANPHVQLIDGHQLTVVFHGPNSYLSPYAFETRVLPTWNSMNVHVRGRGSVLTDQAALLAGLAGICEKSDPGADAYRLDLDDPRIERIIDHIVGFEIEIHELVGRFKISQELDDRNRRLAASAMADTARRDESALIEQVFGLN